MRLWHDLVAPLGRVAKELAQDPALDRLFREDRREALVRQAPIAATVFLVCIVCFSLAETLIRPNHRTAILILSPYPFVICGAAVVAMRQLPAYAVGITVAAVNALIAVVFSYTALVRGSGELIVIAATLILGGVVALLPLGTRNQLRASVAALLGYPIIMQLGAVTWTTPWYSASALVAAVIVMAIGAATIDDYRARILRAALSDARLAQENELLLRRAQAAHDAKADFLAVASHELRTPLSSIVGYAEMLSDGTLDAEDERADALKRIREHAMTMLEMLQNLLDADKIEAGQRRVEWSEFSARALLENLRDNLPPSWRKPGVKLVWDLPSATLVVRSDVAKLTTILRNLLHNATKYTKSGEIRVAAREAADSHVEIAVADTGEGIPAADLPDIFERFRQSRNPSRSGGLGLGLYIVRQFCDAIGATVAVESERDRGTKFTLRVPIPKDRP